jgi:hypothetical protein
MPAHWSISALEFDEGNSAMGHNMPLVYGLTPWNGHPPDEHCVIALGLKSRHLKQFSLMAASRDPFHAAMMTDRNIGGIVITIRDLSNRSSGRSLEPSTSSSRTETGSFLVMVRRIFAFALAFSLGSICTPQGFC